MKKSKFVSIIIPCREIDRYTKKCISECQKLQYPSFEILVLPDAKPGEKQLNGMLKNKLKIIPTGKVRPAIKRNLAMKESKASIYAFIDSDAYPEKNWLKNAVTHLEDGSIGMIGGPNLTPKEAGFRERVSGVILASWLCSGTASIRYKKSPRQESLELPSCNFIVKKECAGEFQSDLLTAEDSKFCFDIWKKGKKIVYAPDVTVYHHRREIFRPHARQMWIYGRDIGYLLKKKGEFSMSKLYYGILSLFVIGVIVGFFMSLLSSLLRTLYVGALSLYGISVFAASINKEIKTIPMVFTGIIITHFSYGLGFLYGLVSTPQNRLNVR